jgi:ATP-dependent protease Clp ATPase subunit
MFASKRSIACSFCGKHSAEVAKLVAGPRSLLRRVYICDSCVRIALRLMAGEDPQRVDSRHSTVAKQSTVDGSSAIKDEGVKRIAFA